MAEQWDPCCIETLLAHTCSLYISNTPCVTVWGDPVVWIVTWVSLDVAMTSEAGGFFPLQLAIVFASTTSGWICLANSNLIACHLQQKNHKGKWM